MPNSVSNFWLGALILPCAVLSIAPASAQTTGGQLLASSEAIAVAAGSTSGIRLHRWLDAEAGVACYLFADGASAPACIRVGARTEPKPAGVRAPLKYSVAVGLIAGSGSVQKMHRVVDEEFAVVCHFLAHARNAPACNRID